MTLELSSVSLFNPSINLTQDVRPLQEDMCDFYASGSGYAYDSYYTEVTLIIIIKMFLYCDQVLEMPHYKLGYFIFRSREDE